MNEQIHNIILLTPLIICLFWFVFFCKASIKGHISQKILCLFFFVSTCIYLCILNIYHYNEPLNPLADSLYSLSNMSVYPIFYLYIVALTGTVKKKHILMFIPAVLISSTMVLAYKMTPISQLNMAANNLIYGGKNLPADFWFRFNKGVHLIMQLTVLISIVLVFYFGSMRFFKSKRMVNMYFSHVEDKDFHEIRNTLTLFMINTCLAAVAELMNRSFILYNPTKTVLLISIFSVLLFFIGYHGSRQKFYINEMDNDSDDLKELEKCVMDNCSTSEKVDSKSGATDNNDVYITFLKDLGVRIDVLIKEEKLFLNPDLKIADLATATGTNKTYIYRALKLINNGKVSFPDYVNGFRLEHSLRLMKEDHERTLAEISVASGFKAESTFYRAFKKAFGMTPRQFMSSL